jgi:hypothetical protein
MEPKYYGAAAEYNKPGGFQFNRRLVFIIVGVLGLIIILWIGTALISAITSGPQRETAKLLARETKLQELVGKSKDRIRSGDLKKVNADANLLLLSDTVTLKGLLQKAYNLDRIPTEIEKAEVDSATDTELKDAERLGKFDRTYVEALRAKVAASLQLAQTVLSSTSNQSLKAALEQNISNLKTIDDQLAELKL